MKVQCEQCGAAYSVADEKVAGRKLRQRCRKCGELIIIDGSALEGGAPQAESFAVSVPADSEAVWHIAVADTTQGPYTLDELGQYYADGHIVLDTLVCRDGWADWKQAGEVPELVSASRASAQPMSAPRSRGPMVPQHIAQAFEQPVTMGSDPFGDAPAAASSPRVTMEELAAPGMQSDRTVQFSMDDIRALSAVSMPSMPAMSTTLPGHATHDDSGLIDMRALAAAEAEAISAASHSTPGSGPNGYRSFSPSQVSSLQAVSPLAFAGQARPTGLDTRTKVMAGLAAFSLVLAAVVVVIALQRGALSGPVAAASTAPAAAAAQPSAPPAAAPPVAAAPTAAEAAAPGEGAAPAATEVASAEQTKAKPRGSRGANSDSASSTRGSKRKGHSPAGADEESTHAAASKTAGSKDKDDDLLSVDSIIAKKPTATKKGSPDIDDLLDGAISAKKAAPKEESAAEAGGGLPQVPGREQMGTAYKQATAKVAKCKGPGNATAMVTLSGKSGRASSVSVSGVEGPAKSCVEKAVRSTSFPKFQKDTFEVKFPFKLGA